VPSSSAKATTSTGQDGCGPPAARRSTTAIAATIPSGPVERPGVRDRVEVRPEDEGTLPCAVPADDVADPVATGRHARLLHPAGDDVRRAREGGRRDAARQPVRLLADLAEHRAAVQDVGGGARHDAGR
jgi:hypothetical protein